MTLTTLAEVSYVLYSVSGKSNAKRDFQCLRTLEIANE